MAVRHGGGGLAVASGKKPEAVRPQGIGEPLQYGKLAVATQQAGVNHQRRTLPCLQAFFHAARGGGREPDKVLPIARGRPGGVGAGNHFPFDPLRAGLLLERGQHFALAVEDCHREVFQNVVANLVEVLHAGLGRDYKIPRNTVGGLKAAFEIESRIDFRGPVLRGDPGGGL